MTVSGNVCRQVESIKVIDGREKALWFFLCSLYYFIGAFPLVIVGVYKVIMIGDIQKLSQRWQTVIDLIAYFSIMYDLFHL